MSEDVMNLTETEADALTECLSVTVAAVEDMFGTIFARGVSPSPPELFTATAQEAAEALGANVFFVTASYEPAINGQEVVIFGEADLAAMIDILSGGDGHIDESFVFDDNAIQAAEQIIGNILYASSAALEPLVGAQLEPAVVLSGFADSGADALSGIEENVAMLYCGIDVEGAEPIRFARVLSSGFAVGITRAALEFMAAAGEPEYEPEPEIIAEPEPALTELDAVFALEPTPDYAAQIQSELATQEFPELDAVFALEPAPDYAAQVQSELESGASGISALEIPVGKQKEIAPQLHYEPFAGASGSETREANLRAVRDVPMQIIVELGQTIMSVEDVRQLEVGNTIKLDKMAGDPVDVIVNDKRLGRGEVQIYEGNYSVRITEYF